MLVVKLVEAHVNTSREQPDQHLQVEEEGWPCSRLMLRDGGNDRNVDLGVASVPEGVEAPSPWGNNSRIGEPNEGSS